jgi:1-deoxy-D-xylulose-5-phosphate reductoisomerase
VDAFLKGALPFTGIVDTVARVVGEHGTPAPGTSLTVADVLQAEDWARARTRELVGTEPRGDAAAREAARA